MPDAHSANHHPGTNHYPGFIAYETRARRRGLSGVWADFSEPYTVRLEAFGQSEAEIGQAIARYLQAYPWEAYRTRFDTARESDGEFVAVGSRNALEGWF